MTRIKIQGGFGAFLCHLKEAVPCANDYGIFLPLVFRRKIVFSLTPVAATTVLNTLHTIVP
jgi:hypothetical protein